MCLHSAQRLCAFFLKNTVLLHNKEVFRLYKMNRALLLLFFGLSSVTTIHVREKLYFLKKGNYSEKISINQALNFDLIGGFLGCLNAQRMFHVIYINVGILSIIR